MFLLAGLRIVREVKFVWKISVFGLASWCKLNRKVHTKVRVHTECWYKKPRERHHFKNVDEDGRIVLKCVLKKQCGRVWIQFVQKRNKLWDCVKCRRNFLKTWATLGLWKRTMLQGKSNCFLVFSLSLFPQMPSHSVPSWGWQTKFYSDIKL
jgi:hypothetical protein